MFEALRGGRLVVAAALGVGVVGAAAAAVRALVAPTPAARVNAVRVSVDHLVVEGDQRLAAGDYRGALERYDHGLQIAPDDLRLLYRAGVALSFLGDREQTRILFETVVRQGDPARPEVRAAQAWLDSAANTSRRPAGRRGVSSP